MTTQEAINIVVAITRDFLEIGYPVYAHADSRVQAYQALEVVESIRIPMNIFEAKRKEQA